MMMRVWSVAFFLIAAAVFAGGAPAVIIHNWKAQWIDFPGAPPQSYGVYHFRRSFDLPVKPERFVVYVSGDNRYQLYANGEPVSWGPARADLAHWRYETVDLAAHLRAGKNVLAAVVWNDGPGRAIAQVTNQTGFLLEPESDENAVAATNGSWRAFEDAAYTPQPLPADQSTGYYALGPTEKVDGTKYPWGWEAADYDDSGWSQAHAITRAASRDARDAPNRWMLVAREIPLEERTPETEMQLRRATGLSGDSKFPAQSLAVPAHSEVSILLDQTYLTTAYPELTVSGGRGAAVELHYAETPYISRKPIEKGNRNDVEGRQFYGPFDTFFADGGSERTYRPLYWRTYRYIELRVRTADEPLTLEKLSAQFTAYPFQSKAVFNVDPAANQEIQKVLATGWRSARLCAHETYMDCPFYEQLEYAGDARIQMMVSLYMTGDARLMKNGIALLNSSRTSEGATYSRAPSNLQQYIPPFSLWWIGMVRDYWMYVDDPDFVRSILPGVEAVLSFYANYQKPDGSLAHMPWWNFVDWVKQWPNGVPPGEEDGSSAAALDLQLLLSLDWAAELESALGKKALADDYRSSAKTLRATILRTDWDAGRGLFADQPSHRTYSQQVNTLAVLARVATGGQARSVVEKMLEDSSLAQSSIYFRAYTNATLREVGLGDRYVSMLGPWRDMLANGLTTWAEWDGSDTRSDCHAWGASPNFEFLRTVAGIESEGAGFKRVRIAPNPGTLAHVSARMPHPAGEIRVELEQSGGKLSATVDLPSGVEGGDFEWKNHRVSLKAGHNQFRF